LVGLGIDANRVCLVSSRNVTDPRGRVEARGAFGYFHVDIFARAWADSPKTSALTAYSILHRARSGRVADRGFFAAIDCISWCSGGRAAHAAACPGVK
jgi:hypothetical protein